MKIFFLYFPIFLSLSFSFLLHAFNTCTKRIHSFLATTFKTTNAKLLLKCHRSISSTSMTTKPPPPPPPPSIDGGAVDRLMTCTESLGFESIDERLVEDEEIDNSDNNGNDEDDCWKRMREAKGRGNWRNIETFPPPLSSLNCNGEPSFILLPVRKNGRLQLNKVRIERPEIMYASRENGRLRLYLVLDQCIVDDVEQECEEEELEEREEETIEKDEVVEESRYEEEDSVREWNCRQVVNQIQCHHHHHLHMYGISIA